MHRLCDLKTIQTLVGDLLLFERLGDHSVDFATSRHSGVSYQPHQPNVTSAVDEGNLPLGEQPSQILRNQSKCPITTRTRPAVDTD